MGTKLQRGGIQRNTGLRTLHACLIALGANPKKVYSRGYHSPGRKIGTLYNRFSCEQLHYWLDELYQDNFKWHPDLHPEDRKFYTQKMAIVNAAYQKGKKILRYKGGRQW